jgi:hypothetical protein
MTTKTYLGDSVYAEIAPTGLIRLTTNNGYSDDPRNVILLEPEVYDALVMWVEHQRKQT